MMHSDIIREMETTEGKKNLLCPRLGKDLYALLLEAKPLKTQSLRATQTEYVILPKEYLSLSSRTTQ